MRHIWFIRHGESESNANLITKHPTQSALTDKGHQQAKRAATYLDQPPQHIAFSDYLRARQTAQPTQARFPDVPTSVWPVHEYTYLAPIRYYNTTGDDRKPWAKAYYERQDPHFKDEGEGESFSELIARLQATLETMQTVKDDFTVVFSHGLFMRALLMSVLNGLPEANAEHMSRYVRFNMGLSTPNCVVCKFALLPSERLIFYGMDFGSGLPWK